LGVGENGEGTMGGMRGAAILEALKEVCRSLDLGRMPDRARIALAMAPLVLPVGVGLSTPGCATDDTGTEQGDDFCSDEIDNDGDGRVDCDDPGCAEAVMCLAVDAYGVLIEDCDNDVDDDGDGDVDCLDGDCLEDPICDASTTNAAPFERDCEDGEDDDGDGLVDCHDPDCDDRDICAGGSGGGG